MKLISKVIIISLTLLSCSSADTAVSSSEFVRKSLGKASAVYIYEGLPHQAYEKEELKKEKLDKKTIEIKGFPFYATKVKASKEVANTVKKILSSENSFTKFEGEKKCGGFHPDYAVSWTIDKEDYTILICYGCGEVMIVSPQKTFRHDIKSPKLKELKKILSKFQRMRPPIKNKG